MVVYNLTMSGLKTHIAVLPAVLILATLLAILVWRGLKYEHAPGSSLELAWREADETDLF